MSRLPAMLKPAASCTPAARLAAREASSAQHVPYVVHADPWTLQTRSGDLVQILRLEGKSFETEDAAELDRLKETRNTLLRALGGGDYALWQHIVRRRVQPMVEGRVPNGFAGDLDAKWFRRLGERRLYVNDLYLSLVRRAPAGSSGLGLRLSRALSPKRDRELGGHEHLRVLRELQRQAENLEAKLAPYGARRLGLVEAGAATWSEPLRFIHHLLTGRDRPVALPRAALDGYLGVMVPPLPLDAYLPGSTDSLGSEAFEMRGPGWSR
ncbi:MAG: hypothetical protein OSA97_14890, partial [Nevskia sp.]|nr:hypothetical protein [Nevskia sp.]